MTRIWMFPLPMVFILPFPILVLREQSCWKNLLYYGISAITLDITGSDRTEGLRACVSQVNPELFPLLEERLKLFRRIIHDFSYFIFKYLTLTLFSIVRI